MHRKWRTLIKVENRINHLNNNYNLGESQEAFKVKMAWDDPVVWILIIAVVVFLFGANKIPQFAKAIGQAKKEFDQAAKEIKNPSPEPTNQPQAAVTGPTAHNLTAAPAQPSAQTGDPLILAAQKEGIDTQGKTRDQIATELAWKLKGN